MISCTTEVIIMLIKIAFKIKFFIFEYEKAANKAVKKITIKNIFESNIIKYFFVRSFFCFLRKLSPPKQLLFCDYRTLYDRILFFLYGIYLFRALFFQTHYHQIYHNKIDSECFFEKIHFDQYHGLTFNISRRIDVKNFTNIIFSKK